MNLFIKIRVSAELMRQTDSGNLLCVGSYIKIKPHTSGKKCGLGNFSTNKRDARGLRVMPERTRHAFEARRSAGYLA